MFPTKKSPKISKQFICNTCDYICCKPSEFNKHLSTNKHKILQNPTLDATPKVYLCKCGKQYKHSSTLYAHKKSCNKCNDNNKISDMDDNNKAVDNTPHSTSTAYEKQLLEQSTIISNLTNLVTTMLEKMSDKIGNNTINNINNNNHISNNVNYNITLFLNDQCKDAMNLSDFVKNIHCQIQDLEYMGKEGYVAGISKMLIDNLSNLEVTKRPIHCTDVKRKSMYIKKDNEWKKDDKNEEVRKAITQVANKNIQNIECWRVQNLDQTGNSVTGGSAKRQQYLSIVGESLDTDDDGKKCDKILKNLGDAVLLDKNVIESNQP